MFWVQIPLTVLFLYAMPILYVPEEAGRLLHPDYWGGHSPLDTDALPETHAELPMGREYRRTMAHLERYVGSMGIGQPIQQFHAGDTFKAAEHAGYTIVIDNEMLGIEDSLDFGAIDFSGVGLPFRLPMYGGTGAKITALAALFRYTHQASLARVDARRGRPRVIGMDSQIVGANASVIAMQNRLRLFPPEMTVGEVQHMRCDMHITHTMRRINRVDVLPPAQPSPSKGYVAERLRRFLQLAPQTA